MPVTGPTAELTARISAGDVEAFGAFYDAWFDAAFTLARTVSRRDESFCLDVVQDAMLKVSQRIPSLRTEAAVSSWMMQTVCSSTIDRLRREARLRRRERRAAAARDEVPDPVAEALGREQSRWLEGQLAQLSGTDRKLVEARFGGDGTVAAAAAALGLGANAAHGRLRRCIERLRRAARDWIGSRDQEP